MAARRDKVHVILARTRLRLKAQPPPIAEAPKGGRQVRLSLPEVGSSTPPAHARGFPTECLTPEAHSIPPSGARKKRNCRMANSQGDRSGAEAAKRHRPSSQQHRAGRSDASKTRDCAHQEVPNARGSDDADSAIKWDEGHARFVFEFRTQGEDEVCFQTTVQAARGSRTHAERISRLCYAQFKAGASKDDVTLYRNKLYGELCEIDLNELTDKLPNGKDGRGSVVPSAGKHRGAYAVAKHAKAVRCKRTIPADSKDNKGKTGGGVACTGPIKTSSADGRSSAVRGAEHHCRARAGANKEGRIGRGVGSTRPVASSDCRRSRQKGRGSGGRGYPTGGQVKLMLSHAADKILLASHRSRLQSMGALFLSDDDDARSATHLILASGSLRRTLRVMCAVCRGQNVVHMGWLRDCLRTRTWVSEAGYEPHSRGDRGAGHRQLQDAICRVRNAGPLLAGRSIYLFPSVQERAALEQIVLAAGGKILTEQPASGSDSHATLLIGSRGDLDVANGTRVHAPEVLFAAAMSQELHEGSQ